MRAINLLLLGPKKLGNFKLDHKLFRTLALEKTIRNTTFLILFNPSFWKCNTSKFWKKVNKGILTLFQSIRSFSLI